MRRSVGLGPSSSELQLIQFGTTVDLIGLNLTATADATRRNTTRDRPRWNVTDDDRASRHHCPFSDRYTFQDERSTADPSSIFDFDRSKASREARILDVMV